MHTALHSISYSGSWGQAQLSVEEIIAHGAELGFDGVTLADKRSHAPVSLSVGTGQLRSRGRFRPRRWPRWPTGLSPIGGRSWRSATRPRGQREFEQHHLLLAV